MSYMTLEQGRGNLEHAEQNEPLLDDYTEDYEFVEEAKRRVKWRKYKRRYQGKPWFWLQQCQNSALKTFKCSCVRTEIDLY